MSEVVSSTPQAEPDIMKIPDNEQSRSADIIAFPGSSTEHVIGSFIEALNTAVEKGSRSSELALAISESLTSRADETPSGEKLALLAARAKGDDFAQADIFDHKDEHDPIFRRLVATLQQTRSRQNSLQDQRRAALRLTELRAALVQDETPDDDKWYAVIDRLFD